MATVAWPTSRLVFPQTLSWGERRKIRGSGDPTLGGDEQTSEVAYSHRWTADIVLSGTPTFAERAFQEAWLSRLKGGANRTTFHHFQHPTPYGTLRGSPVLSGSHAQGATTILISGANGQTVLPGDMLGITTTATYPVQLIRVAIGGTVSGGTVSITIDQPLRASASSGAAIVWDRPAALFRMTDSSWSQTSSAKNAQAISASFIEVLN